MAKFLHKSMKINMCVLFILIRCNNKVIKKLSALIPGVHVFLVRNTIHRG